MNKKDPFAYGRPRGAARKSFSGMRRASLCGPMQGVPLPAPESDREIRLLTREVYCDKLAVKERFIRINLKGDGRWKSCLTGNTG